MKFAKDHIWWIVAIVAFLLYSGKFSLSGTTGAGSTGNPGVPGDPNYNG